MIRERRGVVTETTTETIGDEDDCEVACAEDCLIARRERAVASSNATKDRRTARSATRSASTAIVVDNNAPDDDSEDGDEEDCASIYLVEQGVNVKDREQDATARVGRLL